MRTSVGASSVLCCLAMVCAAFGEPTTGSSANPMPATAPSSRRTIDFNADWRFDKSDVASAMAPEFVDTAWRTLDLPHDWSIEGPFSRDLGSGNGFAPGGVAWYRKHFSVDPADRGKLLAVEFDGVYSYSDVYLNGHYVGGRPYGYSSFECDLTPYLRFGGDAREQNVLAVRVDHSRYADSRWYTGSGIYRNVRLRVTDKLRVEPNSVYVVTPSVSDEAAVVRIEARIANASDRARSVSVKWEVLDPDGKTVGESKALGDVKTDAPRFFRQQFHIDRPQRWSTESPVLYTLRARVFEGATLIDETTTPFGIRTIRFDADKGFILNDKPMKLKGVCIHHDAGCLGAAVPEKVLERRLRLLKELGANAIRCSHNPPAPELLDLCDKLGLLVMDEAFDEFTPTKNKWVVGWNAGVPSRWGYGELFAKWATTDLADMVRRDRNHPSIILWSIGNEIDYANDPFSDPVLGENRFRPWNPPAADLVRLGKPLADLVKQLDPTRPVTAAMANLPMSEAAGFPEILDVAGYNYQEPRYADDHAKHPQRILLGSENNHRFGNWVAVRDNDYVAGQFLWTGIDYLGESRAWPARGSSAGLLDTCGFKKPNAWFRQSLWSDQPMVYLCTASTNGANRNGDPPTTNTAPTSAPAMDPTIAPTAGPNTAFQGGGFPSRRQEESWNRAAGSTVAVTCYTNCDEVRLTLNDKPIGTKRSSDAVDGAITWNVPFEPGTLKAVGYKGGQPASEFALHTAGPAKRIELLPDSTALRSDGKDICHLEFHIIDAAGIRVPDARNLLTFNVTGPAKLLGIDNGEMTLTAESQRPEHAAFHGRGLAILQTARSAGTITVEVTGEGLEPAHLELQSR